MKDRNKKTKDGPWIKLRLEMLASPAWIALGPAAKRVIERLVIEHLRHGGRDNGHLICTHRDFADYGIRYPSIAPAIRQAVDLGFVEITERGWRAAGYGKPAKYRLTFILDANPTDEWKQFKPAPNGAGKSKIQIRKRIRDPDTKMYPEPDTKM
jgi:hypothetical protein